MRSSHGGSGATYRWLQLQLAPRVFEPSLDLRRITIFVDGRVDLTGRVSMPQAYADLRSGIPALVSLRERPANACSKLTYESSYVACVDWLAVILWNRA